MPSSTKTEVTVQGKFIIVKEGSSYKLGVNPVKPGSIIEFEGVGTHIPVFQGNTPFSAQTETGNNLSGTIPTSSSLGCFPFALSTSKGSPSSYPYAINVVSGGEEKATYRYAGGKLRVLLTVEAISNTILSIDFVKEGFTAGVEMTVTHQGQNNTFTIPDGETNYLWSVQLNSTPTTYSFKVAPLVTTEVVSIPQFEVIGSDDCDLDIMPPEG